MAAKGCKFCLENGFLIDAPISRLVRFYLLGSIEPSRPAQVMVVPYQHVETPFELETAEWCELGEAVAHAREHLAQFAPDGFTIGWNVGAVAGQEVFHAHLHVIARFAGETAEGRGIHAALRPPA